jgi:hypothetical protein
MRSGHIPAQHHEAQSRLVQVLAARHRRPDPAKADQYSRWWQLREQQRKNPRSMRHYCQAASREVSSLR